MAGDQDLLLPAAPPPSAAPPLSSRAAPPLSSSAEPSAEVLPAAPTPEAQDDAEAAPAVAALVASSLPVETEPLFLIKVWQLGIVVFVVLLAQLYALGIL